MAEPKKFALPQTPFLGVQDRQNLISWRRSLPSPRDPVWWRSMHAISNYRGNRPTNKHTYKQTGPITINCTTKLSAQCNNVYFSNLQTGAMGMAKKNCLQYRTMQCACIHVNLCILSQ